MEHHNKAGLAVARMLEAHPKIEKVWYPGLESHPDHKIAMEQMKGFGSVISFLVKGGDKETRKFIDSLELFLITPSLGGSESLVTQMCDDVVLRLSRGVPQAHRHGGQPRPACAGAGGRGRPDRGPEAGAWRKSESAVSGMLESKNP